MSSFIIKAGNSSKPGAEFFIAEIILNILSSVTSMVLMLRRLFAIYFNGSMSDFIFSARFLPTLTKKSLNEFAITSGLVVGTVSIINSDCSINNKFRLQIIFKDFKDPWGPCHGTQKFHQFVKYKH